MSEEFIENRSVSERVQVVFICVWQCGLEDTNNRRSHVKAFSRGPGFVHANLSLRPLALRRIQKDILPSLSLDTIISVRLQEIGPSVHCES